MRFWDWVMLKPYALASLLAVAGTIGVFTMALFAINTKEPLIDRDERELLAEQRAKRVWDNAEDVPQDHQFI